MAENPPPPFDTHRHNDWETSLVTLVGASRFYPAGLIGSNSVLMPYFSNLGKLTLVLVVVCVCYIYALVLAPM